MIWDICILRHYGRRRCTAPEPLAPPLMCRGPGASGRRPMEAACTPRLAAIRLRWIPHAWPRPQAAAQPHFWQRASKMTKFMDTHFFSGIGLRTLSGPSANAGWRIKKERGASAALRGCKAQFHVCWFMPWMMEMRGKNSAMTIKPTAPPMPMMRNGSSRLIMDETNTSTSLS